MYKYNGATSAMFINLQISEVLVGQEREFITLQISEVLVGHVRGREGGLLLEIYDISRCDV